MSVNSNHQSNTPSRIPKLKVNSSYGTHTVSSTRIPSIPHVPFNGALYKRISVTRSMFESKKLTSACDFLRELRQKLEQNTGNSTLEFRHSEFESLSVADILESFFDVSNNLAPIVCTSKSKSEIYAPQSIVPEKNFDDIMSAVGKLTKVSKCASEESCDDTLYYSKNFMVNNMETVTVFRSSTLNTYEGKMYIDQALLKQLEELYEVLNDIITKLKYVEENRRGIEDKKTQERTKTIAQEDWEVVDSIKIPRKKTKWKNAIDADISSNDELNVNKRNLKMDTIPEDKSGVNTRASRGGVNEVLRDETSNWPKKGVKTSADVDKFNVTSPECTSGDVVTKQINEKKSSNKTLAKKSSSTIQTCLHKMRDKFPLKCFGKGVPKKLKESDSKTEPEAMESIDWERYHSGGILRDDALLKKNSSRLFTKLKLENKSDMFKCLNDLNEIKERLEYGIAYDVDIGEHLYIFVDEFDDIKCPYFHTVIDGIPIGLKLVKDPHTSPKTSGSIIREGENIGAKSTHAFVTLQSISSSEDSVASNPDVPYVVESTSLPELADVLRTCSSQSIDVSRETNLMDEVKFGTDNEVVKSLGGITRDDLLRSSRPAKCCRKAFLNGTKHGYIPYAASLKSLPLTKRDVNEIKNVIRREMK